MNLWCQSGSDFFDLDFGNWICKKEKEKLYPIFKKNETEKKGAIFEIRQFCCWKGAQDPGLRLCKVCAKWS